MPGRAGGAGPSPGAAPARGAVRGGGAEGRGAERGTAGNGTGAGPGSGAGPGTGSGAPEFGGDGTGVPVSRCRSGAVRMPGWEPRCPAVIAGRDDLGPVGFAQGGEGSGSCCPGESRQSPDSVVEGG